MATHKITRFLIPFEFPTYYLKNQIAVQLCQGKRLVMNLFKKKKEPFSDRLTIFAGCSMQRSPEGSHYSCNKKGQFTSQCKLPLWLIGPCSFKELHPFAFFTTHGRGGGAEKHSRVNVICLPLQVGWPAVVGDQHGEDCREGTSQLHRTLEGDDGSVHYAVL